MRSSSLSVDYSPLKSLSYFMNVLCYFSDDLVQMCVDYIRDYPLLFCLMIGLPILLLIAFVYLTASSPEKPKKQKKKKSKEVGKEN